MAERSGGAVTSGGGTHEFDAIVVGSGLGGLSAAATLARLGRKRVLVLERHRVAGGYTHVFRRPGGYEWDVGLHYTGQMRPGGQIRAFSDFVTDGALDWQRMQDPFDTYVYPDLTFDAHGDRRTQIDALIRLFPSEAKAIRRYYRHIRVLERWSVLKLLEGAVSNPVKPLAGFVKKLGQRMAESRTKDYLDRNFHDPGLKALLCSNYCAYGLPPSQSAFYYHAMVANHYLQGGYYPVGGAGKLAECIVPVIEATGGEVRLSHEVTQILVESGRVTGVEFQTSSDRRSGTFQRANAPIVISDAGFCNTYGRLIPDSVAKPPLSRFTEHLPKFGIMELYIGLEASPAHLGIHGQNVIFLNSDDLDVTFDRSGLTAGSAQCGFLSFPSLKNPEAVAHTAQIFWFVEFSELEKWQGTEWQKRGDDYLELKQRVTDGLLRLIEQRYPGFGELVDRVELSTPLSYEHFVGQPKGTAYGLSMTPARLKETDMGIRSPIENLYFTGADTLMVGIAPAFVVGAFAAGVALGRGGMTRVAAAVGSDYAKRRVAAFR